MLSLQSLSKDQADDSNLLTVVYNISNLKVDYHRNTHNIPDYFRFFNLYGALKHKKYQERLSCGKIIINCEEIFLLSSPSVTFSLRHSFATRRET